MPATREVGSYARAFGGLQGLLETLELRHHDDADLGAAVRRLVGALLPTGVAGAERTLEVVREFAAAEKARNGEGSQVEIVG
jgi:hypothetical protein